MAISHCPYCDAKLRRKELWGGQFKAKIFIFRCGTVINTCDLNDYIIGSKCKGK